MDDAPCPDIHELFQTYNALYFQSSLGACSVEWSTGRMTLVAGTCQFQRASRGNDEAHGGCRIRLSEPLLKYRPAKDVQETLLHEMIHAFIFLHRIRDDGDHGTEFQRIMIRINESHHPADPFRPPGGYHVTVYHSMHEEVEHYRQHWWDCQRCGHQVRRAMNRPPQEADCRGRLGKNCRDPQCTYHVHKRLCGGTYVKTREPEGYGQRKRKGTAKGGAGWDETATDTAMAGRADGGVRGGGGASQGAAVRAGKGIDAYFSHGDSLTARERPPEPTSGAGVSLGQGKSGGGAVVVVSSDSEGPPAESGRGGVAGGVVVLDESDDDGGGSVGGGGVERCREGQAQGQESARTGGAEGRVTEAVGKDGRGGDGGGAVKEAVGGGDRDSPATKRLRCLEAALRRAGG